MNLIFYIRIFYLYQIYDVIRHIAIQIIINKRI